MVAHDVDHGAIKGERPLKTFETDTDVSGKDSHVGIDLVNVDSLRPFAEFKVDIGEDVELHDIEATALRNFDVFDTAGGWIEPSNFAVIFRVGHAVAWVSGRKAALRTAQIAVNQEMGKWPAATQQQDAIVMKANLEFE